MNRPARLPPVLQRPEQGWSSLLLLLGLLILLGLSIADSRPLPLSGSGRSASGWLWLLMVAAALIGFLLARSRLGVVRAHVVGAAVAAFMLLMVAGALLNESTSALPFGYAEMVERISAVWARLDSDIAAYSGDRGATPTTAAYLLLGAICWTTAQFSAFSIFRYGRAGPAVMAIGAVLFLNIGLGATDPDAVLLPVVPMLAVFSALAMLLLIRLQLSQQRQRWARRSIADTGEVGRLFLRSGVLFVSIAVLGASSLTAWATVERQEIDLGSMEGPMDDVGLELSRWLGYLGVPAPRGRVATTIDDSWSIGDQWQQPAGIAFRAEIAGQLRGNYWWGTAHDSFDGQGWDREQLETLAVPAGEPLPIWEGTSAGGEHLLSSTLTVAGEGVVRGTLFRPAEAGLLSRDVEAYVVDEGRGIGDIVFEEPLAVGDAVVIDAWVRDYSPDADSLTANELREAGEDYPEWIGRYLQGTEPEISGQLVAREGRRIAERFDNPYDRALAAQRLLREMTYETDMRGVCGDGEPVPECVLRSEQGFCQHYATTMAMLLRAMGIPSRVITGYLPGERVDGVWVVEQAAYHNWVEAFFPDHGWVRFDPTPRSEFGLTPTAFPEGPAPTPEPDEDLPLEPPDEPELEPEESPQPLVIDEPAADPPIGLGGSLLAAGLLTAALVSTLAALLWLRFRRLTEADGAVAYRGIVRLATRLGYGPHPAQTEYEYAGTLSRSLPGVRDDLYLVAGARVERVYARRPVEGERRDALRRAYARIRSALLRLYLRRR